MAKPLTVPDRMASLPVDKHGRPVPWFVAWIDGQPDHRIVDTPKLGQAVRFRLCWLCGQALGRYLACVIGPMCAVNRVTAEPPCHRDCAVYAAQACPFLTTPSMRRRTSNLPAGRAEAGGVAILRNPGVALVWVTRKVTPFNADGVLFDLGDPTETLWFAEGRRATREEVLASINSGLPALMNMAEQEGPEAVADLEAKHRAALRHIPQERAS